MLQLAEREPSSHALNEASGRREQDVQETAGSSNVMKGNEAQRTEPASSRNSPRAAFLGRGTPGMGPPGTAGSPSTSRTPSGMAPARPLDLSGVGGTACVQLRKGFVRATASRGQAQEGRRVEGKGADVQLDAHGLGSDARNRRHQRPA